MFWDRPSAYDRATNAASDIGQRIADLESRVADRLTPSFAERARRQVARYTPSSRDVRSAYDAAYDGAAHSLSDARSAVSDWWDHLPSWSGAKREAQSRLPDPRLPQLASFRRGAQAQRGYDRLRNNDTLTTVLIAGGALVAIGGAIYITKKIADHSEEPDYDVVRRDGDIEVRDYDAMVVAETVKSGYHEKARRDGFSVLSDYIAGNARDGKRIPMTVPVLQQLSEADGQTKGWAVRFVMPKKYSSATLPAPSTSDVKLKDVPSKRVVAIKFSGNFSASMASRKLMALYNYIAEENLKQKGDPEYAFYNPPWTPSFLKRNEILIAIER